MPGLKSCLTFERLGSMILARIRSVGLVASKLLPVCPITPRTGFAERTGKNSHDCQSNLRSGISAELCLRVSAKHLGISWRGVEGHAKPKGIFVMAAIFQDNRRSLLKHYKVHGCRSSRVILAMLSGGDESGYQGPPPRKNSVARSSISGNAGERPGLRRRDDVLHAIPCVGPLCLAEGLGLTPPSHNGSAHEGNQ